MRTVANPTAGARLLVTAGDVLEITCDFTNDAPEMVSYRLEVSDSPAVAWITPSAPTIAAPNGNGTCRLRIQPPTNAPAGGYPLRLRLLCDGTPVDETGTAVTLWVVPAFQNAAPATTSQPTAPQPSRIPPPPQPSAPPPSQSQSQTAPPPARPVTPPTPALPPRPSIPIPTTPPPEPQSPPVQRTPPTPTPASRETAIPAGVATAPPQTPRTVPSGQTSPSPAAPRPALPTAEEFLPVVDTFVAAREEVAPPGGVADAEPTEANILNPAEGAALSVRPGETLLVRFAFDNTARRVETFILEEDRTLPANWINLVRDQVNITPGGTGEVRLCLSPPEGAEPGSYPFQVRFGPLGGALTPRNLLMVVQAIPAVRLTAEKPVVRSGPFGKATDFALEVARAGNTDTAYRLSVRPADEKPPAATSNASPAPGATPSSRPESDIYETLQWRYAYERELDTLKSLAPNLPPPARPARLRVVRKGVWWFGWQEQHRLCAVASPVTAPDNSGRSENSITLTLNRWRLTPFPEWFLAPIALLLLLFFSGSGHDLTVVNALAAPEGHAFYVLQTGDTPKEDPTKPPLLLTAKLKWQASPTALIGVRGTTTASATTQAEGARATEGALPCFPFSRACSDTVPIREYGTDRLYTVTPLFRSSGDAVVAHFVPIRTVGRLSVEAHNSNGTRQAWNPTTFDVDNGITGAGREVVLRLPNTPGSTVTLHLTNSADGLDVNTWLLDATSGLQIGGITRGQAKQVRLQGAVDITITRGTTAAGSEERVTLLTTDADYQMLRIRVLPQNQ